MRRFPCSSVLAAFVSCVSAAFLMFQYRRATPHPLPPYQTGGGSVSGKSPSAALCSLLAGFFPTAIGERERRAAAAPRRRERLTRVFRHNEAANTFHRVSRSVFLSAIQQFVKCRALHIQHFHSFCSCNIPRFHFCDYTIPIFGLLCFRSA